MTRSVHDGQVLPRLIHVTPHREGWDLHGLMVSSIDFRIKLGSNSNPDSATDRETLRKLLNHSVPQFLNLNRDDNNSAHLM